MTRANTLIFINNRDVHAFAADYVIKRLGHRSHIVNTADVPNGQSMTVQYGDGGEVVLKGNGFALKQSEITSSWNRRTSRLFSIPDYAHPADLDYIRTNSAAVVNGFIALADERFAVNPLASVRVASNKLLQLKAARTVGLRIPKSVVSNDVEDISAFLAEVGSACIKPYYTYGWKTDQGIRQAVTARISSGEPVNSESFTITPNIFQEYIDKQAEYRITVFAGFHAAVKIGSKSLEGAANVDWRADPSYLDFVETAVVPERLIEQCRAILRILGLRFGTFDIGETFDGQFVFFEVNEAGQWLWKELHCPDCRILQPFSEYLVSADERYTWNENHWSSEFSASNVAAAIAEDTRYAETFGRPSPDERSHLADERSGPPSG